MNKKLNLAVAAALAFGASAAQAGITIPAGDWTVDIGGNMNAFYTHTNSSGATAGITGGLAAANTADSANVRTGLLPSALGIGAKTRQNDLDVAFQFTFFVGGDDANGGSALGNNVINVRQSFLTFGDKSWGTIKMGRDIGIYGSEAILSDMTLLGVGGGAAGGGGSSTLGHIGTGYLYADWVGQISYASPNWNGFSFAVGVRDPWSSKSIGGVANAAAVADDTPGFEGKASYDFTGGDVTGKVWVGGIWQDPAATADEAKGWEIGAKAGVAGFEAVAYYYAGEGIGTTSFLLDSHTKAGDGSAAVGKAKDSDGYFLQATYKLPTIGTKIGVSYGESNLDAYDAGELAANGDTQNTQWTVGVYHPLTKSLNLVAEYSQLESEKSGAAAGNGTNRDNAFSLGAILFF